MTDTPTTGGTVRYHRAEYNPDEERWPWCVWFTERDWTFFSAAEGEAMGLTPPEPAPLVVECNGHSVELSDDEASQYSEDWENTYDDSPHGQCAKKLARLLRDARQDPQPASDPAPLSPGEHLRGLLAGRDDADELYEYAMENWRCHVSDTPALHVQLLGAIGDAAREVHG